MKKFIKLIYEKNKNVKNDSNEENCFDKKLENFVNSSFRNLLGYGLKWQMELLILKDGNMYSNAYHPNYKTHYDWKKRIIKGIKEDDYITFTYHRGYDPKNIIKWIKNDYMKMLGN